MNKAVEYAAQDDVQTILNNALNSTQRKREEYTAKTVKIALIVVITNVIISSITAFAASSIYCTYFMGK